MSLLGAGNRQPSIGEIASAADVSRRTVYMHFPTIEQLLIDATLGALSASEVDVAIDSSHPGDARERVDRLVHAMLALSTKAMPLGRRLIRLTVEHDAKGASRGHRRVAWLERALEPLREQLDDEQYERLLSALAMVIGWEALIVLKDVMGLGKPATERVSTWAARALVEAMLREKKRRA